MYHICVNLVHICHRVLIRSCCGVGYGSLRKMSEYFSTTAQAGNAGLLWSDKMLVCLAGFIVREGRVNFNFLRG